ncbi:MAG: hypothetical protein GY866_08235 [Proteobacteria bacterium]|nr:hypothetical protein [Pseudomonadota bacterium]
MELGRFKLKFINYQPMEFFRWISFNYGFFLYETEHPAVVINKGGLEAGYDKIFDGFGITTSYGWGLDYNLIFQISNYFTYGHGVVLNINSKLEWANLGNVKGPKGFDQKAGEKDVLYIGKSVNLGLDFDFIDYSFGLFFGYQDNDSNDIDKLEKVENKRTYVMESFKIPVKEYIIQLLIRF